MPVFVSRVGLVLVCAFCVRVIASVHVGVFVSFPEEAAIDRLPILLVLKRSNTTKVHHQQKSFRQSLRIGQRCFFYQSLKLVFTSLTQSDVKSSSKVGGR